MFLFNIFIFAGCGVQEAVWSWFPPPSAWNCDRAGLRTIEWTERCETWFTKHLTQIREGKVKPKSHSGWISALRGLNLTRTLINHTSRLAIAFVDDVVPIR